MLFFEHPVVLKNHFDIAVTIKPAMGNVTITMSKIIYLVFVMCLLGCAGKPSTMEFESIGRNGTYKLFDDSTYCIVVDNSVAETGNLRSKGDTLFLLKNVKYNITMNPEVLFLIEDDSICRLELQEKENPDATGNLESILNFNRSDYYEYSKKGCVFLNVIPH